MSGELAEKADCPELTFEAANPVKLLHPWTKNARIN